MILPRIWMYPEFRCKFIFCNVTMRVGGFINYPKKLPPLLNMSQKALKKSDTMNLSRPNIVLQVLTARQIAMLVAMLLRRVRQNLLLVIIPEII